MKTNSSPVRDTTAQGAPIVNESVSDCADTAIEWPREAREVMDRYYRTRQAISDGLGPKGYTLADHREDYLDEIVGLMAKHPSITHLMLRRAQAGQKALEEEERLRESRVMPKR